MTMERTPVKEVTQFTGRIDRSQVGLVGRVDSGGSELSGEVRETRSKSRSIKELSLDVNGSVKSRVDSSHITGINEKIVNSKNAEKDSAENICGKSEKVGAIPKNRGVATVNKGTNKNILEVKNQVDGACGTGGDKVTTKSHTHIECSNLHCNEWIVSKDFNLDNFSKHEVEKMNIYCYRCVCEANEENKVRITGMEIVIKEIEEENKKVIERIIEIESERIKDRETIMLMMNEISKLKVQIEAVGNSDRAYAKIMNHKGASEYGIEWSNINERQNKRNYKYDEKYSLKQKEVTKKTVVNSEANSEIVANLGGMSVQEAEVKDDNEQRYPWQKVERKKGQQKEKMPIIVCGDSMVKDISRNVSMKEKGSELCCCPGAEIGNIMEKVKEKCKEGDDDFVVVQGGGNNLLKIGYQKTTEEITNTVKEIMRGKTKRNVGVISILKRPRECMNSKYEQERLKANKQIQEELCKMKINKMQVSFIDMDPVIDDSMFRVDGVHVNGEGNDRMSRRILTWIKQKGNLRNGGSRK